MQDTFANPQTGIFSGDEAAHSGESLGLAALDLGERSEVAAQNAEQTRQKESTPEGVNSQAERLHEIATEYWERYASQQERGSEQGRFEFQNKTHASRQNEIDLLDQEIVKLETDSQEPLKNSESSTTDDTENIDHSTLSIEQYKHRRTQLIIEQAYADVAWAKLQVEKMKQELTEKTTAISRAQSVQELDEIQKQVQIMDAQKIKFEIYTKAAQQLFKDFYQVYPLEAREFFLDLTNELIKKAEISEHQHRFDGENDANLLIIGQQIDQVNQIDWHHLNELIDRRKTDLQAQIPTSLETSTTSVTEMTTTSTTLSPDDEPGEHQSVLNQTNRWKEEVLATLETDSEKTSAPLHEEISA